MRAEPSAALRVLLACLLCACSGTDLILGDGNGIADASSGEPPAEQPRAETPPAEMPPAGVTFQPPRVISELDTEDVADDDPSLSEDRLLLCFNSKRDGGQGKEDIWCTSRSDTAATWAKPEPVAVLNTEHRETGIALSGDGLSLWFSSDRQDSDTGLDVYTSVRASRAASWPAPVLVPELSSADDDLVSSVDERETLLFLARRVDDDDDYDVWTAQRTAAAEPWQAPQPLGDVNTDDEESDAFLVGAGLQLIFTRDGDLMLSHRANPTAKFDRGEPIESLNSDEDDRDAWADAKLDYVIFSSDRDGPHRLYEATR
jgi:hypothetical protein